MGMFGTEYAQFKKRKKRRGLVGRYDNNYFQTLEGAVGWRLILLGAGWWKEAVDTQKEADVLGRKEISSKQCCPWALGLLAAEEPQGAEDMGAHSPG